MYFPFWQLEVLFGLRRQRQQPNHQLASKADLVRRQQVNLSLDFQHALWILLIGIGARFHPERMTFIH
jgi:hypothetical protein